MVRGFATAARALLMPHGTTKRHFLLEEMAGFGPAPGVRVASCSQDASKCELHSIGLRENGHLEFNRI